jgi:hypothetical protein
MSKMLKIIIPLLVVLIIGIVVIGVLGYVLFSRKADDAEVVFAATEVGTPVGPHVTKDIGPAGGTLASPDGRLKLSVPQNALTETVAFSIQPITNKFDGGLGLAYRLEPDGKTFNPPLDISVHYDDHDLEGTFPEALSVAYQDKEGAWHAQKSLKLDQAAKTLTVATTHFTDFAELATLRIWPITATLHVNEELHIQGYLCKKQSLWDKLWSRPVCQILKGAAWALRGPGRLDFERYSHGVNYTAPAKKPTPNHAEVNLSGKFTVWNPDTGEDLTAQKSFTTAITIIDGEYRASGKSGDTVFSGDICDLGQKFTLKTNNPFLPSVKFVPSSPTEGTWSFSLRNGIAGGGDGKYTITGTDASKTGIEMNGWSTGTYKGITKSGGGPMHIDLVPLKDECKP